MYGDVSILCNVTKDWCSIASIVDFEIQDFFFTAARDAISAEPAPTRGLGRL